MRIPIISDLVERRVERQAERRGFLDDWSTEMLLASFGGGSTKAKVQVDHRTALASNAVACAVAVRSRTMGSLPTAVKTSVDGKRTDAPDHPAAAIFKGGPCAWLTWPQYQRWSETTVLLTGNSYARVRWEKGRAVGFSPMYGRTRPFLTDAGVLGYEHTPVRRGPSNQVTYGERVVIAASDVIHRKWDILTEDGLEGRSLVDLAREAIGLDIAAEEFLARVLANGTHMGVVLTTPNALTKDQFEQILKQLSDGRGLTPAGKARLFQNGVKPEVLGGSVSDADLDTQRHSINERIATLAGVPVTLLNDLTNGTMNNTEQSDITYTKHYLLSAVIDHEAVLNSRLFVGQDTGRFYVKMDLRGIQRGDFLTRMQGYEIGIRSGMWSPNQVLEWEDEDGYEGGDLHVMQAQMTPVESLGSNLAAVSVVQGADGSTATRYELKPAQRFLPRSELERRASSAKVRVKLAQSHRAAFAEAAQKLITREIADVRAAAEKALTTRDAESFQTWLNRYYRDFPTEVQTALGPVTADLGEAVARSAADEVGSDIDLKALQTFLTGYLGVTGKRWAGSSRTQLRGLLANADTALADVNARLDEWDEKRADKVATRETVELNGAVCRMAWAAAGVTSLVWVNTSEKSCPYCTELDGTVVGMEQSFAADGDTVGGDMAVNGDKFHPPLHQGCECVIVPG